MNKPRSSFYTLLTLLLPITLTCILSPGCKKKAPNSQHPNSDSSATSTSPSQAEQEGLDPSQARLNSNPEAKAFDNALQVGEAVSSNEPSDSSQTPSVDEKEKPKETCFTQVYRHRQLKSHQSSEACSQHRNLIKISQTHINPKSICIRVNGSPVPFTSVKGHPDEFIIGPIAGPKAIVTARYCLEGFSCADTCKIPKDDFMDAIGGSLDSTTQAVQWDAETQGKSKNIMAELDPAVRKELSDTADLTIFEDWNSEEQVATCKVPAEVIQRVKANLMKGKTEVSLNKE